MTDRQADIVIGGAVLLLALLLAACDSAPVPAPSVTIEHVAIAERGDEGTARIRVDNAPDGTRLRLDHTSCQRTVLTVWVQDVDTTWTAGTCPPDPAQEQFQAVLWTYRGPVLATDTYAVSRRTPTIHTP